MDDFSVIRLLVVACLLHTVSTATQYSGSFNVNIPFDEIELLLKKMAVVTDVIQTLKADQDSMKEEQSDLKEHILKRLDAIDEKTEWLLTKGQQWAHQLSDRIMDQRQILNASVPKPSDCQDVYSKVSTQSGVYRIYPDGSHSIEVYCEQRLDGGGWTVFQQRQDGSVDFYRNWTDYKTGFGNLSGEFWLGNDNLHLLTKGHDQKLKIELKHNTNTAYADYSKFWVEDEDDKYRLQVSGFSGAKPPGDSFMKRHNGKPFTTKDQDNDEHSSYNCAVDRQGAWWYDDCYDCNLNGPYGGRVKYKVLNWNSWKGVYVPLTGTRMMIKRSD